MQTNNSYISGLAPFYVVAYLDGQFNGVVSGLGRNKGKWDASHSKRTADKYAKKLNQENTIAGMVYKVETDH